MSNEPIVEVREVVIQASSQEVERRLKDLAARRKYTLEEIGDSTYRIFEARGGRGPVTIDLTVKSEDRTGCSSRVVLTGTMPLPETGRLGRSMLARTFRLQLKTMDDQYIRPIRFTEDRGLQ